MGVAGSDAFWKFHDLAFQNQQNLTDANFEKWAQESGADVNKFKEAYKAKKYAAKVDEDMALANKIGANGTPAFRINGVTLSGAQPFDKFKEVIDEQLAEAKKLIAAGTKPADVYVELTKKNFTAPAAQPQQAAQKAAPEEEDKTVWKVPVSADDPVKGPKDALVTIIELSEFQCPFCKRCGDTTKQIAADLPERRAHRVEGQPAAVPPARQARRDPRAPRLQDQGRQGLLGRARRAVREPAGARGRQPEDDRRQDRPALGRHQERRSTATSTWTRSIRAPIWPWTSRRAARRTSSSTAGA